MARAGDEDEYEYEYDTTETETFLLDLDISSLNGVIKSRTPGFRRTLQQPLARHTKKQRHAQRIHATAEDEESRAGGEDNVDVEAPSNSPPPAPREPVVGSDIQILDLHTHNPLVSYQDQIYSCTWSDMIGTNMFFSSHERRPIFEPQASTDHYDLLGTSRIKLIGHRTKITQKPGTKKRGRPPNDTGREVEVEGASIDVDEVLQPGKSLGNLRYNNAKVNADIKRQAHFLEKLMDVKRAKGEMDNVRTIVTRQSVMASNKARQESRAGEHQRAALHEEVEKLNRQVVRGESTALVRLQEIYSLLEGDGDEASGSPPETPTIPDSSTPSQITNTGTIQSTPNQQSAAALHDAAG